MVKYTKLMIMTMMLKMTYHSESSPGHKAGRYFYSQPSHVFPIYL